MNYIKLPEGQYPVSEKDIRTATPNTSYPAPFVPPEGYKLVFTSSQPKYDAITQAVREVQPVLTDKGHYEQQWEIYSLPEEQVQLNLAVKADADSKLVNDKIEALWASADKYTSSFISGVAIGILTIGAMQQKPKALAVSSWSSSIWAEYYRRKSLVTVQSTDDHDFSSFGPIPYSVPELQSEIGL